MTQTLLPDGYPAFLKELRQRIRDAQLRASVAVNSQLVLLYWQIGREILIRQENEQWGAKVIDRLSADLRKSFPEMKGFHLAISNTCGLSRKLGRKRSLCSRLLHKFPGFTIACC